MNDTLARVLPYMQLWDYQRSALRSLGMTDREIDEAIKWLKKSETVPAALHRMRLRLAGNVCESGPTPNS